MRSIKDSFNSFLYNNNLFIYSITKKQFRLAIHDFSSLELIKEYKYGMNEKIEIMSTLYPDGYKTSIKGDSEISRSLAKGSPVICVNEYDPKHYVLRIGSYKPPAAYSSAPGAPGVPSTFVAPSFSTVRASNTFKFFDALLDKETLEPAS